MHAVTAGDVEAALYLCDSTALLERLAPGSAALVYLDPPSPPDNDFVPHSHDQSIDLYFRFIVAVIAQSRRVLSAGGTVYLHLPPRNGSYVRIVADQIFGAVPPSEDIAWSPRHGPALRRRHETIVVYSKSSSPTRNAVFRNLSESDLETYRADARDQRGPFRLTTPFVKGERGGDRGLAWRGYAPPNGYSWRFSHLRLDELQAEGRLIISGRMPKYKVYLSERAGIEAGTLWDDIEYRLSHSERVDFPTQRPLALLERIIERATNPGDLVVDPFVGTGTALIAAARKRRRWIGCDNSPDVVEIARKRLQVLVAPGEQFRVLGVEDLAVSLSQRFEIEPPRQLPGLFNRIERLIADGESQVCEFKANYCKNPDEQWRKDPLTEGCLRAIVAFLNTVGGTLLIGVSDNANVNGLNRLPKYASRDDFQLHMTHLIEQAIGVGSAPLIRLTIEVVQQKEVCVIECKPSPAPVYLEVHNGKQEFYVRSGPSSRRLELKDAIEYILHRFSRA